MRNPKVLIGGAVCHKPAILKESLESLKNLNTHGIKADFLFIDDNIICESKELLKNFGADGSNVHVVDNHNKYEYICTQDTHIWNESLIWKVAGLKNAIISYACNNNYNYLFLIDSDILLHPDTLLHLINADKDIISEIIWTRWSSRTPRLPQVWLYDRYKLYEPEPDTHLTGREAHRRAREFLDKLKIPGIYKVGGLGACTLISEIALGSGVSFKKIPNISIWGEDRHFCIRAAVLGFDLFVDTFYPAYHVYRDSDLLGVEAFKSKCGYAGRKSE